MSSRERVHREDADYQCSERRSISYPPDPALFKKGAASKGSPSRHSAIDCMMLAAGTNPDTATGAGIDSTIP
jgi:hypothetical protein